MTSCWWQSTLAVLIFGLTLPFCIVLSRKDRPLDKILVSQGEFIINDAGESQPARNSGRNNQLDIWDRSSQALFHGARRNQKFDQLHMSLQAWTPAYLEMVTSESPGKTMVNPITNSSDNDQSSKETEVVVRIKTKPEFSEHERQCNSQFESPYTPWLNKALTEDLVASRKQGTWQTDPANAWKQKCIQGGNDEDIFETPKNMSPGSCYGCWSYTTNEPLRIQSNLPLSASHHAPEKRPGMIMFEPHVHFDRPKGSVASFRQVVMNAMRYLVLAINFQRKVYMTGIEGFGKVKDFTVCKGTVSNLKATAMDIKDAYFETYGDTLEFVVKSMTLTAALDYSFKLKIPPTPVCVGDTGHLTVQAVADIRMRFDSHSNAGACSYDNMGVQILSVPDSNYPEWMVKLSAKKLSSDSGAGFNLVPLIGASALEEMCKQFRGWNSRSFQDMSRLPKMEGLKPFLDSDGKRVFYNKQVPHPEVDVVPKIPTNVIIIGACGVVLQIVLLVGSCCFCQYCGWRCHARQKGKELDAKRDNGQSSEWAITAQKKSIAELKFCKCTCSR